MWQSDNCLFDTYRATSEYDAISPVAFHITLSLGSSFQVTIFMIIMKLNN